MILIGQYDSPFVRRVGVTLTLYGMAFEHRPWSTFGDVERIRPLNPLTKVPTLILDDGTMLTDSHVILAHLDPLVPEDVRLMPADPGERVRVLRLVGLATGLADVTVSLFYELKLHEAASDLLVARRTGQLAGTLALLEADAPPPDAEVWVGRRMSHADVALAASLRFVFEVHGERIGRDRFPALAARSARMEALPVFQAISQPFVAPA